MIEWVAFFCVMALGQFAPGPDMLLLTRTALAEGRRAGWYTAAGIAAGLSLHAGVAVAGWALVLAGGGELARWMSVLAAIYLFYLGGQLLRSSYRSKGVKWESERANSQARTHWQHWLRGFWCNLLNPKVAVFLAGVMTPFLATNEGAGWKVILWVTVFTEGFILWCGWVWLLQLGGVRRVYSRLVSWIDGLFGLVLLLMGGLLLCGVIC